MSDGTCCYNQTHGVFNRRETRMVAQALGLPEERIEGKLTKLGIGETISTSDLIGLIEKGTFVLDINHMYNYQSGRYNSLVFSKALKLIDAHLFSFNEILKARLAFDIYEMNALRNDKDNAELILQTIKFCEYRISRVKLEHRLRHYNLNNSRVLHLNEYFDLLLLCQRDNTQLSPPKKKIIDLVNPKPVDQQMMEELNKKYLRDERNWYFEEKFPKEKFVENAVWPAKVAHQYQVEEASHRRAQLQRQLSTSITSLKQSRAGSACSTRLHLSSATFRQSPYDSKLSFRSLTPVIDRTNNNSVMQSNRSVVPEIDTKNKEISTHLQQLEANAAFLAMKYAIHREDYFKELLPNGYKKPIIMNKPPERCLVKKPRESMYYSQRITTK